MLVFCGPCGSATLALPMALHRAATLALSFESSTNSSLLKEVQRHRTELLQLSERTITAGQGVGSNRALRCQLLRRRCRRRRRRPRCRRRRCVAATVPLRAGSTGAEPSNKQAAGTAAASAIIMSTCAATRAPH